MSSGVKWLPAVLVLVVSAGCVVLVRPSRIALRVEKGGEGLAHEACLRMGFPQGLSDGGMPFTCIQIHGDEPVIVRASGDLVVVEGNHARATEFAIQLQAVACKGGVQVDLVEPR